MNQRTRARAFFQCLLIVASALVRAVALPSESDFARITHRFATEHGFNGVVLVGKGSRIEYIEAFGVADVGRARAMSADTRFEAGSISKWIAAIVVMKVVDEKKLALDTPITAYLPDYRADTGAKLTLRRLLSHSSGLPDQVLEARKKDESVKSAELPLQEAVKRYASGDLAFAPGEQWDYSHANWILVKAVVEKASGQRYEDLIDRMLVQPLRLKNSGIFAGDSAAVENAAVGYAALTPAPQRKTSPMPAYMAMAGGYYASAPDMLKLMDGVLDGRLLSAESRKTLMTTLMPAQHYALGGRVRSQEIAGKTYVFADEYGSNGAYRVLAKRALQDGRTIIVMNNTSFDHMLIGKLADELQAALYP